MQVLKKCRAACNRLLNYIIYKQITAMICQIQLKNLLTIALHVPRSKENFL